MSEKNALDIVHHMLHPFFSLNGPDDWIIYTVDEEVGSSLVPLAFAFVKGKKIHNNFCSLYESGPIVWIL